MRTPNLSIAAAALLLIGGCASSSSTDTGPDHAAVSIGTNAWMNAYNSGDADSVVALYTKDAVVMPPHAPAVSGQAAIRSFIVADIAGAKDAGVRLVNGRGDARVCGDMGWHHGSYTVKDKSGATVDSGSYMEAWQKVDGKWLIARDIWNSDRPIPQP